MDSVCVLYLTAVTFSATGLRFSDDERLWGPEHGCRQRANTKTMLTAIFLLSYSGFLYNKLISWRSLKG